MIINFTLDYRMGLLKDKLLALFNEFSGRNLKYSSLSPSILQYIEIRDLEIYDNKPDQAVLFKAKNLRIHYNLFGLVFSPDPLSAISEINIEHSEFNLDMQKEKELAEALEKFIKERLSQKLDMEFRLTGSNLQFNISDNNYNLLLSKLFLTIANDKEIYEYKVRGNVHLDSKEQGRTSLWLDTELDLAGKVHKEFIWFNMLVNILSTESENFTLAQQQFQISMNENLLSVNKIQDSKPIDIACNYDLKREALTVNFITENWQPAYMLQFKRELSEYNPWLYAAISAEGELEYQLSDNTTEYSLFLNAGLEASGSTPHIRLKTRLQGNERIFYLEPLAVSSNDSVMEFRGSVLTTNLYPAGTLLLSNVATGYTGSITGNFQIQRAYNGFALASDMVTIGQADFSSFTLNLQPKRGAILFDLDTTLADKNSAPQLIAEGSIKYSPDFLFDSHWEIGDLPLNQLYSILTPNNQQSRSLYDSLKYYTVSSSLKLSTDFNDLSFSSAKTTLNDIQNEHNSLTIDVDADTKHIQCKEFNGSWFGVPLSGDFIVDLSPGSSSHFATVLNLNEIPYNIEGFVIPDQGLVLSGSYDLDASFIFSKQEAMRFWVKTDMLPLPLADQRLKLSLNLIGFVKDNGEWQIASTHSKLFNVPVLSGSDEDNFLDASFLLTESELELSEVTFHDSISEINGKGHFDISAFSPLTSSGWFYLQNKELDESYTVELEFLPDAMDVNLAFTNSPLQRLGDFIVKGNVSGTIKAFGGYNNPAVDAVLSLKQGTFNNSPFSCEVSFSLTDQFFALKSFECQYNNNYTVTDASGMLDKTNGEFQFKAHLAGNFLGEIFDADSLYAGILSDFNYEKPFSPFWDTNFTGRVQFFNIAARKVDGPLKDYQSWEILFNKDSKAFLFSGGPEHALVGEVKREGTFTVDLLPPLPLYGHMQGTVNDSLVEAKIEDMYCDLMLLNPIIGSKYFVFKGGTARGELAITGDVNDPEFYGLLEINDGAVSTLVSPDIIKPINTALVFQQKEMKFSNINTAIGRTPVRVFALLTLKNWVPVTYGLELETLSDKGLHLAFPVGIVKIDGYFLTSNFKLVGDHMSLSAKGEILAPQCNVTLTNPEQTQEQESVFAYAYLVDLKVKTGKDVEFTWPSREFPIIQAVAKPNTDIAVNYNGSSGKFTILADIGLQSGEVFYFDRSFFIKSGKITLHEDENHFDPLLSLEAERREQFDDKDLKIFLTLKNQYLSEFEPRFRSEPPLASEYDILAALGGAFQGQESETGESALDLALNLGSDILTQFWVLRPFERAVKEILNLDVFSIRTQVVKNILVDRVFTTESGVPPTNDLETRNYLENTTINLGQYIGNKNDLYFEMVLRFQSLDENATEYESINTQSNINVESEFSLELTTPFFLTIKWTITPQHWESFFLPDNKITLKWGFSF
ncbi:MAG: hypothetical protein JW822_10450 [Spirochaetales bacterium]|nr:hypothetical protein [Spirochaetales bacterium]